jgi:hypothetical protein
VPISATSLQSAAHQLLLLWPPYRLRLERRRLEVKLAAVHKRCNQLRAQLNTLNATTTPGLTWLIHLTSSLRPALPPSLHKSRILSIWFRSATSEQPFRICGLQTPSSRISATSTVGGPNCAKLADDLRWEAVTKDAVSSFNGSKFRIALLKCTTEHGSTHRFYRCLLAMDHAMRVYTLIGSLPGSDSGVRDAAHAPDGAEARG